MALVGYVIYELENPNTIMATGTGGVSGTGVVHASIPLGPYSPSIVYSTGQAFTWSGATITVTSTGVGVSNTTIDNCNTPDIAIWT